MSQTDHHQPLNQWVLWRQWAEICLNLVRLWPSGGYSFKYRLKTNAEQENIQFYFNKISPYSMPLSRKMRPMVKNVSFLFFWSSISLQSPFCSRIWTGELHGSSVHTASPDPLRNADIISTAASPIKADRADTTPKPSFRNTAQCFSGSPQPGCVCRPAQRTPRQGMRDWNP